MRWQVQEAKQRLSEVLRAVETDGAQTITRHGKDVAVVVDIAEYRRLTGPTSDLTGLLLGGPKSDALAEVLDGADVRRAVDPNRDLDLG